MAAFTVIEAFLGFFLTLVVDVFGVMLFHNQIVTTIFGANLVISNLDYQVINVIMYVIIGVPIAALIFTAIYAINEIIYKAKLGY